MISHKLKPIFLFVLTAIFMGACASGPTGKIEGAYRGPEKFGREVYETAGPNVQLSKKVRVVLLTFQDERPKNPELDWTRQVNVYGDSSGQPLEIRPELEKAIISGLKQHPKIELISPSVFFKNREADLVVSGRILKSQAHRGANVFAAETVLEVTFRDEFGNLFWKTPVRVQGFGKSGYRDTGFYDEIEPGRVGVALTDSIQAAANDFLNKRAFTQALGRAQSGPKRELAAEEVRAPARPE